MSVSGAADRAESNTRDWHSMHLRAGPFFRGIGILGAVNIDFWDL